MPGGFGWEVKPQRKSKCFTVAFQYGDDKVRYFTSHKSYADAWKMERAFAKRYWKRLDTMYSPKKKRK